MITKIMYSSRMKSIIISVVVCVLFHCSVLAANAPTPFPQPSNLKKAKRTPPPPPPPPYKPNFDFFILSETWPATYCKIHTCVSQIPPPIRFKVHGLWPNNITDPQPEDCSPGNTITTNLNDIAPILNGLRTNWPSLLKSTEPIISADNKLWTHEWKKHGSCSYPFLTFGEYFKTALNLYNKNDLMAILTKEGIKPGNLVSKVDIVNAIFKNINVKPQIDCKSIQKTYYLYEIRLCFTASKDPQYKDCNVQYKNCGPDKVYY